MAARRQVRYEEYAAHGPADDAHGDGDENTRIAPARSATRGSSGAKRSSPPTNSAATSHRQNDAYMEAFDTAYEDLVQKHGGMAISDTKRQQNSLQEALPARLKKHNATREQESVPLTRGGELSGSWVTGPASPEGTVHNVSAQPIMCMSMSVDEMEIAVGSSDHAVYTIPVSRTKAAKSLYSGTRPRTLYTKKFGHTEWVTCSTYLPNNRLVTGGMDSKICLWDASGVKCEDLVGHSGSITLVRPLGEGLVLSASYDKTVRVWNVGSKGVGGRDVGSMKVGSAPILDASVLVQTESGDATPGVITGDRDGSVHLLDLDADKVTRKIAGAHKGHTTSVLASRFDGSALCFSGGQDGAVRVWDLRQSSLAAAHALELHVDSTSGKAGAVGFLQEPLDDGNVLITGGADGSIKVLDKRKSFKTLFNFTEHMDFIYSMHIRGQLCFSGAGNGMLHVHDWKQGKLLYGLGANKAAVRAIETTSSQLIAAGDDGTVMIYDML